MSRAQQDQFIDDDEEETCPLCVEEFDLTDKGFKPCPCGYQVRPLEPGPVMKFVEMATDKRPQICQFCYHNVKTNMNGLCPACRRPYDDKNIEYKVITPEESAAHKARVAQKQKKTQAALQKEKQKAEADHLSRKHLAGLRVVQKNLVYVTGLSPSSQEDQLLQTLRGDQYFGQYGKIIKIVVSKAKDPSHPHSVGVYVTYERKDDAAGCIAAVNGSKNGDRTLRAQFGTTKYCSAYLRGETCMNRNCMFLHEPGEANESYSRADLSSLNAGSAQQDHGRAPPQSQQPLASASQSMVRQGSDEAQSPTADRPALPSTASWASKPLQASRAESRSTSGTMDSPAPVQATPAFTQPEQPDEEPPMAPEPSSNQQAVQQTTSQPERPRKARSDVALLNYMKTFAPDAFKFYFSLASIPEADLEIVKNYPPLFDLSGGAKRRLRRQREEEQRRMEQEARAFQQPPTTDAEDPPEMSGSLQLGGEPEERQGLGQSHSAIQPPRPLDGMLDDRFRFGAFGGSSSPSISDRGMTPQQHQQLLLQTMKSPNGQQGSFLNNLNQPSGFQQQSHPPGHQRNASRYSFANDSSASTAVKPVANAKLLSQQSSIMPPAGSNHYGGHHQTHGNQFYTSNVQGPPPGLKTTGTPPVSGGMTFGQGHGFATGGLQYGANAASGRNANEEMMRNLLRGREASINGGEAGKRESYSFPNYAANTGAFPSAASAGSQSNAFPPGPPSYASLSSFSGEEKQRKKKGKKHRHANTSSSSGLGDLGAAGSDLTSNHMLQSRLQHGGFGGQAGGASNLYSVMHGGGAGGYSGRW